MRVSSELPYTARTSGGEASSSGTHDYELVVNMVTDEEGDTPAPINTSEPQAVWPSRQQQRIIARFGPQESRYDDGLRSSDSDIDMRAVRTLRQDLPEDEDRTYDEGAHGRNVPLVGESLPVLKCLYSTLQKMLRSEGV